MFSKKDDVKKRIDNMNSADRDEAIRRLERERTKLNEEIESILASYAKESGNRALRQKKTGFSRVEDLFISYGE